MMSHHSASTTKQPPQRATTGVVLVLFAICVRAADGRSRDSGGATGQPDRSRSAIRRIRDVTPQLMLRHNTPGVSVAIVESGQIVHVANFGVQRAGTQQPVTESTIFEACSMSKPLFAYGVLRLVEQQRLQLDRPLVEYLPQPYLRDEPLHHQITAQMVLNHSSGFPNWREGGWRAGGPLPVKFQPGTRFGYSGEGFWYLQQVIEQIVDEPAEPWIQRVVMQPIGMTSSSFIWQSEFASTAAAGHAADGSVKTDRRLYDRANVAFTLYTTATDYARFLKDVMSEERERPHRVSDDMIRRMLRPEILTDQADVYRSLGWAVTKTDRGPLVWHSGANGSGFRCHCRFSTADGDALVIMTNAIGGAAVWQGIVDSIHWP